MYGEVARRERSGEVRLAGLLEYRIIEAILASVAIDVHVHPTYHTDHIVDLGLSTQGHLGRQVLCIAERAAAAWHDRDLEDGIGVLEVPAGYSMTRLVKSDGLLFLGRDDLVRLKPANYANWVVVVVM